MSKIDVLEDEEDEEVDRQPGIAIKDGMMRKTKLHAERRISL